MLVERSSTKTTRWTREATGSTSDPTGPADPGEPGRPTPGARVAPGPTGSVPPGAETVAAGTSLACAAGLEGGWTRTGSTSSQSFSGGLPGAFPRGGEGRSADTMVMLNGNVRPPPEPRDPPGRPTSVGTRHANPSSPAWATSDRANGNANRRIDAPLQQLFKAPALPGR